MKLNVDASFSLQDDMGATGAVLRDDHGAFIAGSSCGIAHVPDASIKMGSSLLVKLAALK